MDKPAKTMYDAHDRRPNDAARKGAAMNTSFVPIISAVFVLLGAFDFFYCWKAYQKATPTGRWISLSALAAGIITEAYLASISTYSYRLASVAASIYFLMIDWMLIALVHFSYVFTELPSTRKTMFLRSAIDLIAVLDSLVMLVNIFQEIAVHYVQRETLISHYAYQMKPLYYAHLGFTYLLVLVCLAILIHKSLKTPREYRHQYLLIVMAIGVVVLVNAVFLYPEDLTKSYTLVDYSIIGYSVGLYLMYWAAFEYREKNMPRELSMTVFENIDQGIVLFDYEDKLIMRNEKADRIFQDFRFRRSLKRQEFTALCGLPEEPTDRDTFRVLCELPGKNLTPIQCSFRRIRGQQEQVTGNLYVFSELSDDNDMLTGFQRWQSFRKFILENPYHFSQHAAVAIFDIVSLGHINQTFGMEIGDQRIRNLARLLRRYMPRDTCFVRGFDAHLVAVCDRMTEPEIMTYVDKVLETCGHSVVFGVSATMPRVARTKQEAESHDGAAARMADTSYELETDEILHAIEVASHALAVKKLMTAKTHHSQTLTSLIRALEESDSDTEAHVQRTQKMGETLARRIGFNDAQIADLKLLCLLHDIGKVGIPLEILNKPGKLNTSEWEVMKTHAEKGYQIAMSSDELRSIAPMIRSHHERWDGKGYPEGLAGQNIPLLSRMIALVDAYDAMVNDRAYRKGLEPEKAQEEIRNNAGTQFDPVLVEEFLKMLEGNPEIALGEKTGGEEIHRLILDVMNTEDTGTTRPVACSRYLLDINEMIIEVDSRFEEITGYSRENAVGRLNQFDLVPEVDRSYYMMQVNNQFSKGDFAYLQHNLQRKNGEVIQVICYGKRYFDSAAKAYRSEILIFPIRTGFELL